jgi:hypothetical protein
MMIISRSPEGDQCRWTGLFLPLEDGYKISMTSPLEVRKADELEIRLNRWNIWGEFLDAV